MLTCFDGPDKPGYTRSRVQCPTRGCGQDPALSVITLRIGFRRETDLSYSCIEHSLDLLYTHNIDGR